MKVRRHRCQHNLRKQPTFSLPPLVFPQSDAREMSAKNSLLMTHHYPDLGSAPDWLCRFNQVFLMALGSDVSSVWNFCTCFLDVILQGNQWFFLQAKVSSAGGVLDCNGRKPISCWEGGGDVCGYFLLQNKVFHDFFSQKEGGIDPIQKWLLD